MTAAGTKNRGSACGCCEDACPIFKDPFTRADETIDDTPATDSTGQWVCVGTSPPEAKWKILSNRLTVDVPSGLTTSLANRPRATHASDGFQRAMSFATDLWLPAPGASVLLQIIMNISSTTFMTAWAEFACGEDTECGTMRILVQDEDGHSAAEQVGAAVPVPGLTSGVKHRARICLDFDLKLCTIACDGNWHHAGDMPFDDSFTGLPEKCSCHIYPDQGTEGLYQFDNVSISQLLSHPQDYGYGYYGDNGCPCCRPGGCESITEGFDGIEVQRIRITGSPTGGTYTLGWNDGTDDYETDPIDFDASKTAVQDALRAIPGLEGAFVSTSGEKPNYLHEITFAGVSDPNELTVVSNDLTGGDSPGVVIVTFKAYAALGCLWDGTGTVTPNPEASGGNGFVTLEGETLTWKGSTSGLDTDCLIDDTALVSVNFRATEYGAAMSATIGNLTVTATVESSDGAGDGTLALSTGETTALDLTIDTEATLCLSVYGPDALTSCGGASLQTIADMGDITVISISGSSVEVTSVTISHNLFKEDCGQCQEATIDCDGCFGGKAPYYLILRVHGNHDADPPFHPECEDVNGTWILPPVVIGECGWASGGLAVSITPGTGLVDIAVFLGVGYGAYFNASLPANDDGQVDCAALAAGVELTLCFNGFFGPPLGPEPGPPCLVCTWESVTIQMAL